MISLLVLLLIAGVIVYFINAVIPMDGKFKLAFNCIIAIVLVIYLANFFFGPLDIPGRWNRR